MENKCIFILEMTGEADTGELEACWKVDVDKWITDVENNGEELPFRTIAKLDCPGGHIGIGFPSELIQWFEGTPDRQIVDRAVLKIIELIR